MSKVKAVPNTLRNIAEEKHDVVEEASKTSE